MPSTNPVNDFMGFTPTTKKTSAEGNTLGQETFMKLLVAQMRQQNPMEPSDDKEMIAQMTQFSILEKLTSVATASEAAATSGSIQQSLAVIGHDVSYQNADGTTGTGVVEQMSFVDGKPILKIGGVDGISPSQITQVR
jgi:flagellar basal-body rod modification protein FlgD